MKRAIAFIAMFALIAGFILSCQKAEGSERAKKQDTEAEVQRGIKQGVTEVVSEKGAAEQKSGKKEKPWKSWKYEGLLTEQEQEEFKALKKRWFGPGFDEADALRALEIFTKAKLRVEEIDAYPEPKGNQLWHLTEDFCEVVRYLAGRGNREALEEFKKILRQCWDKPLEVECVLEVVGWYGDREVVPLLRRYVRYEWPRKYYASEDEEYVRQIKRYNERVRLKAAAALLSLGDADTALPVLEELALKEGWTQALYYLFRGPGKIIDERGYAIVEKALKSPRAEIRISAVKLLYDAGKLSKEKAEEMALEILEELKDRKLEDYGLRPVNPKESIEIKPLPGLKIDVKKADARFGSDSRACESAVGLLGKLKSKKALPVLRYILTSRGIEWWYTCKWGIKEALKTIEENGGGE